MARKTLSEKRISDTRHLYHFEEVVAPQLNNVRTNDATTLVISDVAKTVFLTLAIIALQIILFLALKNHLARIPGISY